MSIAYQIIIGGDISCSWVARLKQVLADELATLGLEFDRDVSWQLSADIPRPDPMRASLLVYLGNESSQESISGLERFLQSGSSILPLVTKIESVEVAIPEILQPINCLSFEGDGLARISAAILECLRLLPRQRKVFLSYRRDDSQQVALQLHEALSSWQFRVFLDTHTVQPAVEFQELLWHELHDSDVLLMLDTENYFSSPWTRKEFLRAQVSGIQALRLSWPGMKYDYKVETAANIPLTASDFTEQSLLSENALQAIRSEIEGVRSLTFATRSSSLHSRTRGSFQVDGKDVASAFFQIMESKGHGNLILRLQDGRRVDVYPKVGVPTTYDLQQALDNAISAGAHAAVVSYDRVSIAKDYIEHMKWINRSSKAKVCYMEVNDLANELIDWEVCA